MTYIIKGNTPSKSNCYKVIRLGNRCGLGKQKKLESYENSFKLQMLNYKYNLIESEFKFIIDVYYDSRRPDLDNSLKVVLDCAHGAAYKIGPEILLDHGVDLIPINIKPTGKNINHNCGALFPENLKNTVIKNNADLGIAFDGDADRLIICDENGYLIDGDKILAIVSSSLSSQGKLKGKGIVATKMSNLGLHAFLNDINLNVYECAVGDRYVIEKMRIKKCNLGGEQSGHIIFSDLSCTGDAILSALQVLSILKIEGKKLSQLLAGFKGTNQKLVNFKLNSDSEEIINNNHFKKKIKGWEKLLKKEGSILIRKSGTENLLRVMVQSYDKNMTNKIIKNIKNFINEIDKK